MICIIEFNRWGDAENPNKTLYYRDLGDTSYADYIAREDAADRTLTKEECAEYDHSYIGYTNNRKGSTGNFCYGDKTLEECKKTLRENRSVVYDIVLSFTKEQAKNIVYDRPSAKKFVDKHIDELFKFKQLSIKKDDYGYIGAFHTNTNNPHIHILAYVNKTPEIKSQEIYKFNTRHIAAFKYKCLESINKSFKASYYKESAFVTDYFKTKNDKDLSNQYLYELKTKVKENIIKENGEMNNDHIFSYARLSNENRRLVRSFVKTIIENNKELNEHYLSFKKLLVNDQKLRIDEYKSAGLEVPKSILYYSKIRLDDINNRCCNNVIKLMNSTHLETLEGNRARMKEMKMNEKSRKILESEKKKDKRRVMDKGRKLIKASLNSFSSSMCADIEKERRQYLYELEQKRRQAEMEMY